MWLVANSGGRLAVESGGIGFYTQFGITERMKSRDELLWIE